MLSTDTVKNGVRRMIPGRRRRNLKLAAALSAAQGLMSWAGNRIGRRRRGPNYGKLAAGGLAAAAVAVPLGMLVGNRLRSHEPAMAGATASNGETPNL
jgi:hypothetical protein